MDIHWSAGELCSVAESSRTNFIRGRRLMREVRGPRQLRLTSACLVAGVLLVLGAAAPVLAAPTGVTAVVHEGDTEVPPLGGLVEGCTVHLHFSAEAATAGDWAIRADDEHGADVLTGSFDPPAARPGAGCRHARSHERPRTSSSDDESPIDRSFDELPFDVAASSRRPPTAARTRSTRVARSPPTGASWASPGRRGSAAEHRRGRHTSRRRRTCDLRWASWDCWRSGRASGAAARSDTPPSDRGRSPATMRSGPMQR